jgi:hypothetical protein
LGTGEPLTCENGVSVVWRVTFAVVL